MRLAASSTEYVHIPVTPPEGVDLTGTEPRMAFLPASVRTNPEEADWITGSWAGGDALVLVGPDAEAIELDPGSYWVWINVDPPGGENIVRRAGTLSVY